MTAQDRNVNGSGRILVLFWAGSHTKRPIPSVCRWIQLRGQRTLVPTNRVAAVDGVVNKTARNPAGPFSQADMQDSTARHR